MAKTNVLTLMSDWAVSTGAFRRNKTSVEKKVVAAGLCNAGFSYRGVAGMLGGLSYIGVRDAFVSLGRSMPGEARAAREQVAIDGSDVRIDGTGFYLWLARDVVSGNIMAFHGSPSGSAEDGARFLADVGRLCANRPAVRLGQPYDALKGMQNLDLYFEAEADQPESMSLIGRIGRLFMGSPVRRIE